MSNRGLPPPPVLEIPQNADHECTVLIWRTGAGMRGALGHPGHASVLLRRNLNRGRWYFATEFANEEATVSGAEFDPDELRYISFWPVGVSDKGARRRSGEDSTASGMLSRRDGEFEVCHLADYIREMGANARTLLDRGGAPLAGQLVIGQDMYREDIWGQEYQVQLGLNALAPSRPGVLGLDMNRMVAWCVAFRHSPEFNYTYLSRSRNCSGVAIRALCAGGAEAFAELGGSASKGTIYFTPSDAEIWCRSAATGLQRANSMLRALHHLAHRRRLRGDSDGGMRRGDDLPTVAAWKAQSRVANSVRGAEMRAIDDALAAYHRTSWEADFPRRMESLVKIIKNTHAHLTMKENARTASLTGLARSILGVVERLAQAAGQPWDEADFTGTEHLRPGRG